MKKLLLGLILINVSLLAIDVEIESFELELQKEATYLKITKDELDLILEKRGRKNKISFTESRQIKYSNFHIVNYLNASKNIIAETIKVNNVVGIDISKINGKLISEYSLSYIIAENRLEIIKKIQSDLNKITPCLSKELKYSITENKISFYGSKEYLNFIKSSIEKNIL